MNTKKPDDGVKTAFLNGLQQFLNDKGKVLFPYPRLAGKVIDLHGLYNRVTSSGGSQKATDRELWEDFLLELNFPVVSTSLSYGLRTIYHRYLEEYEKVHYFGDDEVSKKQRIDYSIRRSRHPNYISEHDRASYGLSATRLSEPRFATDISDYERIAFSLTSGLPNEVDFAINACTLLSGESRHVLRLSRCPQLLEALLLHAGIVSQDINSYASIADSWQEKSGHSFHRFWQDTIKDKDVLKEMLSDYSNTNTKTNEQLKSASTSADLPSSVDLDVVFAKLKPDDCSHKDWSFLFQSKRSLGVQDYEGQRILQIALVLLNLSFESFNVSLLAKNRPLIRFVFLCVYSSYSSLRQTGLDILGNLSSNMNIESLGINLMECTYLTAERCIKSPDKFDQIRGYEVLGNLCKSSGNKESLLVSLNDNMFKSSVLVLTIGDIELALAAIEALYSLSKLGEETCTRIAIVPGSIDILVCLITFNVRTLGSGQLSAIRIARRIAPSQPQPPTLQQAPPPPQAVHQQYHVQRPGFPQPVRLPHVVHPNPTMPPMLPTVPAARTIYPVPTPTPHVATPQSKPAPKKDSRPVGAGPTYTHSETNSTPPVYHYIPAPPPDIVLDKSPESFAQLWVWATYEQCTNEDGSVPRVQLFADYASAAGQYGMCSKNQVLPAADFGRCLQRVFSNTASRLFNDCNGQPMYHITGIRKRQTPLPVPGHHPLNSDLAKSAAAAAAAAAQSPANNAAQVPAEIVAQSQVSAGAEAPIPAGASVQVPADAVPPVTARVSPEISGPFPASSSSAVNPAAEQTKTPAADEEAVPVAAHGAELISKQHNPAADLNHRTATSQANGLPNSSSPESLLNGDLEPKPGSPIEQSKPKAVAASPATKLNQMAEEKHLPNGDLCNDIEFDQSTDRLKPPPHCEETKNSKKVIASPITEATVACAEIDGPTRNLKGEVMCNGVADDPPLSKVDMIITNDLEVGHSPSSEPALVNGSMPPSPEDLPAPNEQAKTQQHKLNNGVNHEDSKPAWAPQKVAGKTPEPADSIPAKKTQAITSPQTSPIAPTQLDRYYKVQKDEGEQKSSEIPTSAPVPGVSPVVGSTNGYPIVPSSTATPTAPAILPSPTMPTATAAANAQQIVVRVGTKRPANAPVVDQPPMKQPRILPAAPRPQQPQVHPAPPPSSHPLQTTTSGHVVSAHAPNHNPTMGQAAPLHQPQSSTQPHPGAVGATPGARKPPPIDLMAPNASMMVLLRNTGKQPFEDFSDEKEDPISKSLRLTSTLILTNVARHCDYGRSLLQRHENWFAQLAMSGLDCSPNLAKLLADLDR